jgi:hypothetical protein
MASTSLPVLAGITSTVIFAASALPMLVKARRTRDLTSYSRSNIMLSNVGNAVHSIYVFSMPVGPIWLLHTFYLASSALMLFWSVRYTAERGQDEPVEPSTGWGEEFECDAVGVAEAHGRAIVRILDLTVLDAELVESQRPLRELRSVRAAERHVVEADPELAEPLVERRPGVLVQPDERVRAYEVHGVVEAAVGVFVDHGIGIEERSVPGHADREVAYGQRNVGEGWEPLHALIPP